MSRAISLFVWSIWVACTTAAAVVIWRQGPLLPWSDDWNMIPIISGARPLDFSWLVAQHNEHRIVLPKLVFVAVSAISGADYRWLILVNLALLSATSALLLLTVRNIRGRLQAIDAFIPLLMLHTSQGALAWGFQFQFVSAAMLSCGLLALCLWQGPIFSLKAAAVAGGALLMLPLCGGNGLLYVPVLGSWLGLRGFRQLKTPGQTPEARMQRCAGLCLLGASFGAWLLSAAYFIGYQTTPHPWPKAGVILTLRTAGRVLSSAFGPRAEGSFPRAPLSMMLLVFAVLGWLVAQAMRRSEDRLFKFRHLDLSAFLLANLVLAVGVGYGRGGREWNGGLSIHYATLAIPALATIYVALALTHPTALTIAARTGLCVVMALFSVPYFESFVRSTEGRRAETLAVLTDLRADLPATAITERHIGKLFFEDSPEARGLVERGIQQLRRARFARFSSTPSPL